MSQDRPKTSSSAQIADMLSPTITRLLEKNKGVSTEVISGAFGTYEKELGNLFNLLDGVKVELEKDVVKQNTMLQQKVVDLGISIRSIMQDKLSLMAGLYIVMAHRAEMERNDNTAHSLYTKAVVCLNKLNKLVGLWDGDNQSYYEYASSKQKTLQSKMSESLVTDEGITPATIEQPRKEGLAAQSDQVNNDEKIPSEKIKIR